MEGPSTVWSYRISRNEAGTKLTELALLREGRPYWAYRKMQAAGEGCDVRGAMEALFDLLSGISKELPASEVGDLLSTVSSITYDLTGLS